VHAAGDDFLAAARLALDQDGKVGVAILADLRAQLLHRNAAADQAARVFRLRRLGGQLGRLVGMDAQQGLQQLLGVGRLGDEIGGAEGAGVAGVGLVVLPGEDDDLDGRRMGQQVGDQGKPFVRLVRPGRQPEVDQRQFRRGVPAAQQADAVGPRAGGGDLEFASQEEGQGVDDERVVIDDQEGRLAGFRVGHADACPDLRCS